MYLKQVINSVFLELEEALLQMQNVEYTMLSKTLFNASIGQHVRHIIELFQCLQNGYDAGTVNYEKRKRDLFIETDIVLAVSLLREIISRLDREDKPIRVKASFGCDSEEISVNSNYIREVVYNLEHTIHHMALIRVGIAELTNIEVPGSFGVAPSTIQYRKACAQ